MVPLIEHKFFCVGFDQSGVALDFAGKFLKKKALHDRASLALYPIPARLPEQESMVDLVADVVTLQHCDTAAHEAMYREIARVLKLGGRFFSVHWIGGESARIFPAHPELSQWSNEADVVALIERAGLTVTYCERVLKTYHQQRDQGVWAVLEAVKP
jgi:SAM-dependent methyltransferase